MHEPMVLEQTHLSPTLSLGDPTAGGYGELQPRVHRASDPTPTETRGEQTVSLD